MSNVRLQADQGTKVDVDAALLYAAYNRAPLNILLTTVATLIYAPVLWQFLPSKWMTVWVAALFANVVVNYCVWVAFQRVKPVNDAIARWRIFFIVQCALGGASWAIGPALMTPQATGMQVALFVSLLFCICSVVIISVSEQLTAMQIYVTIVMAPVAIAAWFSGDDVKRTIAMCLTNGIFVMIYVGRKANQATRRELTGVAERAREDENRRLSEQIAHLDRQRSLGEMSAQLGHELNQPLTAILTNAQVIKRGLGGANMDDARYNELNDKIIHNTKRAAEIVVRIREFIQPHALRREPVDLIHVVHEVAYLIASDVRRHQVDLDLSGCVPTVLVMGDSIQLSQIVLNVLRNAIDALEKVAQRQIRVTCVTVDEHVLLRISDTGPGLTSDALAQAGLPFFTTKPSGLGLGISISRTIAAQHGGTLTFSNADGGGAIVDLYLPALAQVQP